MFSYMLYYRYVGRKPTVLIFSIKLVSSCSAYFLTLASHVIAYSPKMRWLCFALHFICTQNKHYYNVFKIHSFVLLFGTSLKNLKLSIKKFIEDAGRTKKNTSVRNNKEKKWNLCLLFLVEPAVKLHMNALPAYFHIA